MSLNRGDAVQSDFEQVVCRHVIGNGQDVVQHRVEPGKVVRGVPLVGWAARRCRCGETLLEQLLVEPAARNICLKEQLLGHVRVIRQQLQYQLCQCRLGLQGQERAEALTGANVAQRFFSSLVCTECKSNRHAVLAEIKPSGCRAIAGTFDHAGGHAQFHLVDPGVLNGSRDPVAVDRQRSNAACVETGSTFLVGSLASKRGQTIDVDVGGRGVHGLIVAKE